MEFNRGFREEVLHCRIGSSEKIRTGQLHCR